MVVLQVTRKSEGQPFWNGSILPKCLVKPSLPHRSFALLILFYPGNIMIEYAYPECTTSVLTALSIFKRHYPNYRRDDIEYVLNDPLPL